MIPLHRLPHERPSNINSFVTVKFTDSPQSRPVRALFPRDAAALLRNTRTRGREVVNVAWSTSLGVVKGWRRKSLRGCSGRRKSGCITPGREREAPHHPAHDRPSPLLLTSSTRARRGHETENGNRPHGTGGGRRSEGSNVGCSHAAGCPLFPLLRASLQGWRDYYCDSEDQWLGCARYQMSLTGDRVPISLLPNGAYARHLENAAVGVDRSGAAGQEQRPRQEPPVQDTSWAPGGASWSQPAPAQPAQPAQWSQPVPMGWQAAADFGPSSPMVPAGSHHRPSQAPQTSGPPHAPTRHTGRNPRSKRGWWARFTEWMGGPA